MPARSLTTNRYRGTADDGKCVLTRLTMDAGRQAGRDRALPTYSTVATRALSYPPRQQR